MNNPTCQTLCLSSYRNLTGKTSYQVQKAMDRGEIPYIRTKSNGIVRIPKSASPLEPIGPLFPDTAPIQTLYEAGQLLGMSAETIRTYLVTNPAVLAVVPIKGTIGITADSLAKFLGQPELYIWPDHLEATEAAPEPPVDTVVSETTPEPLIRMSDRARQHLEEYTGERLNNVEYGHTALNSIGEWLATADQPDHVKGFVADLLFSLDDTLRELVRYP